MAIPPRRRKLDDVSFNSATATREWHKYKREDRKKSKLLRVACLDFVALRTHLTYAVWWKKPPSSGTEVRRVVVQGRKIDLAREGGKKANREMDSLALHSAWESVDRGGDGGGDATTIMMIEQHPRGGWKKAGRRRRKEALFRCGSLHIPKSLTCRSTWHNHSLFCPILLTSVNKALSWKSIGDWN